MSAQVARTESQAALDTAGLMAEARAAWLAAETENQRQEREYRERERQRIAERIRDTFRRVLGLEVTGDSTDVAIGGMPPIVLQYTTDDDGYRPDGIAVLAPCRTCGVLAQCAQVVTEEYRDTPNLAGLGRILAEIDAGSVTQFCEACAARTREAQRLASTRAVDATPTLEARLLNLLGELHDAWHAGEGV